MERLSANTAPQGITSSALRVWGLLFLALGIVGRGIIQTHILGIGQLSPQQLLEAMTASRMTMILVTVSLVLQAMETCAAPIFAWLLVTGVEHTSDFWKYVLRVLGLAVLSELPYNLAIGGQLLSVESRNPVFALALGMIMLYFYRRYAGKALGLTLIRLVVTVAGILWGQMLKVDFGAPMVLMIAVLWGFRKKPLYRNFAGAAASVVCTLFSPFFLAAPMGFLAVHFYNGEKGDSSPVVNYLAYPMLLLAAALVGILT